MYYTNLIFLMYIVWLERIEIRKPIIKVQQQVKNVYPTEVPCFHCDRLMQRSAVKVAKHIVVLYLRMYVGSLAIEKSNA